MEPPDRDLEDRKVIWDVMQNFWMDTDPAMLLPQVVEVCAASKYSIDELELIYWNEVRPAVAFNLWMIPAPEWAGFEIGWLTERILKKHRFGKPLPWKWLHRDAEAWWSRLRAAIIARRDELDA
jgi:hypothetical protein